MKRGKKNKLEDPERARAKPHDEKKAAGHAWAAGSENLLTGVGGIEYEDAETFQRRNEALLELAPRSDETVLAPRPDGKRGLIRRLQDAADFYDKLAAIRERNAQEKRTPNPANRRAAVDAYIQDVLERTGKKITRADFWKAAGYKTRTEFERWQRSDTKHENKAADANFTRVLTKKPHLKTIS